MGKEATYIHPCFAGIGLHVINNVMATIFYNYSSRAITADYEVKQVGYHAEII